MHRSNSLFPLPQYFIVIKSNKNRNSDEQMSSNRMTRKAAEEGKSLLLNYWSFQKLPEVRYIIRFKKGVHKEGCLDYWKNTNCFIEWEGTLTSLLFPGSYIVISSSHGDTTITAMPQPLIVFPCREKILFNSHLNLYCNQSPTLRSHTENSWLFFSKKEFMWLKRGATSLLSFLFFSLISPVFKSFP